MITTNQLHADGQKEHVNVLETTFRRKLAKLKHQIWPSRAQKQEAIDKLEKEFKKEKKDSNTSLF